MKTIILVSMLACSGIFASLGTNAHFKWEVQGEAHAAENTIQNKMSHKIYDDKSLQTKGQTNTVDSSSIIATQGEEINNTASSAAANATRIEEVEKQLATLALTQALDSAKMNARLDVDEGKIFTAITVVGVVFSLGMSVLLFFHIDDRFGRSRRATSDRIDNQRKLFGRE